MSENVLNKIQNLLTKAYELNEYKEELMNY
jgi:hypothetical protein